MVRGQVERVLPIITLPERRLGRGWYITAQSRKTGSKGVTGLRPMAEHTGVIQCNIRLVQPDGHWLAGRARGVRQHAAAQKPVINYLFIVGAHILFGQDRHSDQIGPGLKVGARIKAGVFESLAVKRAALISRDESALELLQNPRSPL